MNRALKFIDITADADREEVIALFDDWRKDNPNADMDERIEMREFIINGFLPVHFHSYD